MEQDMNQPSSEDDQLKSLLQAGAPALSDDGFSLRVIAALPRPAPSITLYVWLYAFGTVAGIVFARAKGASWSDLATGVTGLANAFDPILALFGDPWLALAIAITGLSLLLTFVINRQQARLW
jgi:hypothetical protein